MNLVPGRLDRPTNTPGSGKHLNVAVREAETGPSRHFAPRGNSVAFGLKRTFGRIYEYTA
jgi:hypothetical protein